SLTSSTTTHSAAPLTASLPRPDPLPIDRPDSITHVANPNERTPDHHESNAAESHRRPRLPRTARRRDSDTRAWRGPHRRRLCRRDLPRTAPISRAVPDAAAAALHSG